MADNNNKVKEALRLVERDWNQTITVQATHVPDGKQVNFSFKYEKVIGNGSFGIVCEVKDAFSDETMAIKKVFQDKGYQIIKTLAHPNIVRLHKFFYSSDESNEGVYLNLVLEYIPSTIYRAVRNYTRSRQYMPSFLLYLYQLLKSLKYIHSLGVCHRDIKPQNLLLNATTGEVKLCDFGSAKKLVPGEDNVAYICSRYYRAPEVIFGSSRYTISIDVWSAGCVFAEMLVGKPFFVGKNSVDQLVEIIRVLGTPTKDQVEAMNQNYLDFHFPDVKPQPLAKLFPSKIEPDGIDLISQLLQYNPKTRITAADALLHPYFNELKLPGAKLLSGAALPPHLFVENGL